MTNKTFARPTLADRYTAQAKADRRRAAIERREARLAGFTTEVEERRALYNNIGR